MFLEFGKSSIIDYTMIAHVMRTGKKNTTTRCARIDIFMYRISEYRRIQRVGLTPDWQTSWRCGGVKLWPPSFTRNAYVHTCTHPLQRNPAVRLFTPRPCRTKPMTGVYIRLCTINTVRRVEGAVRCGFFLFFSSGLSVTVALVSLVWGMRAVL